MPKRTYVGDNAGVILILAGETVEVKRGEDVEVPQELAAEMDVSDAWAVPGKDKKEAVDAR